MRYGLRFADGDPFPQDVEFGVQLEDEAPIVVPEECPECPPSTVCEVICYGWDCFQTSSVSSSAFQRNDSSNNDILFISNAALSFSPQGEWCGHKRRFVFDPNTLTATYATTVLTTNGSETGFHIKFGAIPSPNYGSAYTGKLKYQIDLTDAEPGEETWTDICVLITMRQAFGG